MQESHSKIPFVNKLHLRKSPDKSDEYELYEGSERFKCL